MRLDKWLWAARFYKTRSLAADAVDGGKVRVNGAPAKPARNIRIGDRLRLHVGDQDWELEVLGLNEQRRPAAEAQSLYAETPESFEGRARAALLRHLAPAAVPERKGRPTKRDRRQLARFHES